MSILPAVQHHSLNARGRRQPISREVQPERDGGRVAEGLSSQSALGRLKSAGGRETLEAAPLVQRGRIVAEPHVCPTPQRQRPLTQHVIYLAPRYVIGSRRENKTNGRLHSIRTRRADEVRVNEHVCVVFSQFRSNLHPSQRSLTRFTVRGMNFSRGRSACQRTYSAQIRSLVGSVWQQARLSTASRQDVKI